MNHDGRKVYKKKHIKYVGKPNEPVGNNTYFMCLNFKKFQ